jgi:hypothetical protein
MIVERSTHWSHHPVRMPTAFHTVSRLTGVERARVQLVRIPYLIVPTRVKTFPAGGSRTMMLSFTAPGRERERCLTGMERNDGKRHDSVSI